MTHSRPAIRELIARSGHDPRRQFGQNFVADPNTVRKIAHLARVGPGSNVVEVGAGLGSLTLALAETGAQVTAVEIDANLVPVLRDVVGGLPTVEVVEADAMTLNWESLLAGAGEWTLVANLPYNVATPLICDLLDDAHQITRMVVMVQREVAERFAAGPGDEAYGAVSVKTAYWATARVVAAVPASVFIPRPNVESAVVEMTRRPPGDMPAACATPDRLFELVRRAFNQRRKMLRRSLGGVVTPAAFADAGIDPTDRPEDLGIEAWCRLAHAVGTTTSTQAQR